MLGTVKTPKLDNVKIQNVITRRIFFLVGQKNFQNKIQCKK